MRQLFLNLLILLILVSCVGTIKDNSNSIQGGVRIPPIEISFDGVESATPVSHQRIRLSFKQASGGSGNFSYRAYIDGSLMNSASISANQAVPDAQGYLHLVVDGLIMGRSYNFNVQAVDTDYNEQDGNTVDISATTLDYYVPIFDGIIAVENVAGLRGENSLFARWNPAVEAAPNPDPFGSNPYAISGYNIYVGQSEESLTLIASVPSDTTSYEIENLDSGVNYLVRVRAFDSQIPPIEDLNKINKELKTLTTQPIDFGGISNLTIPQDSSGHNTLKIQWLPGTGSFDKYKVYVSSTPKYAINPASDVPVATVNNLSTNQIQITVTQPHSTYYAAVLACKGDNCSDYKGETKVLSIKTTPPVALFNGIRDITQPDGVLGLTTLDLSWPAPDTSKGVLNEFRVF